MGQGRSFEFAFPVRAIRVERRRYAARLDVHLRPELEIRSSNGRSARGGPRRHAGTGLPRAPDFRSVGFEVDPVELFDAGNPGDLRQVVCGGLSRIARH